MDLGDSASLRIVFIVPRTARRDGANIYTNGCKRHLEREEGKTANQQPRKDTTRTSTKVE